MAKKAFLEITNACNLACTFCHGTNRPVRYMTTEEFTHAATEIRPHAEYLYFHLMGEPLLHPKLAEFLAIAGKMGFRVILTTNGTLLPRQTDVLLSAKGLHKVSVSLHSFEANEGGVPFDDYLNGCFDFAERAAGQGIVTVLRLWNLGGAESLNQEILRRMHEFFDDPGATEQKGEEFPWKKLYSGYKIKEYIFLEWGEKFDWPDLSAEVRGEVHSCYGLRDQFGVLSDGTVVPCCLDADGGIPLGNLFDAPLSDILHSPRAEALRRSFVTRKITEPLCLRCGYAAAKRK